MWAEQFILQLYGVHFSSSPLSTTFLPLSGFHERSFSSPPARNRGLQSPCSASRIRGLDLLWGQATIWREKKGNGDPYTHVRFRPRFFWSEKRIPLRVLGAFSDATATAAAKFQLQYEACLGAGPDGKGKKVVSLILSVLTGGGPLPTPQKTMPGLFLEFFLCPMHSSRIHTAFRRGQETQEPNRELATRLFILQVLVPFPIHLPFLLQSCQMAASCILSRVFSSI